MSAENTTAPGGWIVLGATSAMGRAFARAAAGTGAAVALAGRDIADMDATASDIRLTTGVEVSVWLFDAADPNAPADLAQRAAAWAETLDGALNAAVFIGSMPEQDEIDADPALIGPVARDNYAALAESLHRLAPLFEAQKGGAIIGVGSVAGDRGRIKNYVYGAAKAAFHTYLSGLRNRLGRCGAHVMTVKPGFVDTAMTWGLPGMFLVARPEEVAESCLAGLSKGRNVLYVPWFWIGIMTIIRTVPERIFKKLSI